MFHILSVVLLAISISAHLSQATERDGRCTDASVESYVRSFPGGDSCLTNLNSLYSYRDSPSNSSTLDVVCTTGCGEVYSTYLDLICDNETVDNELSLWCLPTNGTSSLGDRCYYSLPKNIDVSLLTNLSACESVPISFQCNNQCVQALNELLDQLGCCLEDVYTDNLLDSYVQEGYLSINDTVSIRNVIDNSYLFMTLCSVDTLPSCSFNGQPFSGESVLVSGICKEVNVLSLVPLSCAMSYGSAFTGDINSPTARAAWDMICTDVCGEKIANYQNETCFDLIGSTVAKVSCLQTEGTLGDRCRYSFLDVYGTQVIGAALACQDFLSDNMTCPTTCGGLIRSISEETGCCFQSIYNSSVIYLFSDNEEADSSFYDVIRDPLLWDICEVPLVSACLDEPFRVTSTLTSTTRSNEMDGASMKLAASTLVIFSLNMVVSISGLF